MKKGAKMPTAQIKSGSLAPALAAVDSRKRARGLWRKFTRKPHGSFVRPFGQIMAVEVIDESLCEWPCVHINATAHGMMRALIGACPIEVSWLTACTRHNDDIEINDIFVPHQICSLSSTEVTGEAGLLAALMAQKRYDSIKCLNGWGHSHVHGAVFASGIDETQTRDFVARAKDMGKDFFVRLIANKWDDLFATLYLFDQGLVFLHVPITVDPPETDRWRAWAKEEVEAKVKKMQFIPAKHRRNQAPFVHNGPGHDARTIIVTKTGIGQFAQPFPLADANDNKEGKS